MKRQQIGELEELVLLAVGGMPDEAYAVTILNMLKEEAGRNVDVTAVHAVLRRLEDKSLVKSSMGGATNERGGRRKKFFTLTNAGRETLEYSMEVRTAMFQKLPKLSFATFQL